MARKLKIGGRKITVPDPTKFDRLSQDDLYMALEQALSNATVQVDRWRVAGVSPDEKRACTVLAEVHLMTALEAVRAMLRKVAL